MRKTPIRKMAEDASRDGQSGPAFAFSYLSKEASITPFMRQAFRELLDAIPTSPECTNPNCASPWSRIVAKRGYSVCELCYCQIKRLCAVPRCDFSVMGFDEKHDVLCPGHSEECLSTISDVKTSDYADSCKILARKPELSYSQAWAELQKAKKKKALAEHDLRIGNRINRKFKETAT